MHRAALDFVARTLATLPIPASVVEIGSRQINGSVRGLFAEGTVYTGIDVEDGNGVDVVADGTVWEPAEPVDLVVTTEVLEHAEAAQAIIANAYRMLAEGGALLVTCAGPDRLPHNGNNGSPEMAPDEWYRNITAGELCEWARAAGFTDVVTETGPGDVYLVARK